MGCEGSGGEGRRKGQVEAMVREGARMGTILDAKEVIEHCDHQVVVEVETSASDGKREDGQPRGLAVAQNENVGLRGPLAPSRLADGLISLYVRGGREGVDSCFEERGGGRLIWCGGC